MKKLTKIFYIVLIALLSLSFSNDKKYTNNTNVKNFNSSEKETFNLNDINPELKKYLELSPHEKAIQITPVPYVIKSYSSKTSLSNFNDVNASIFDATFDLRNDSGLNNVTSVKNQQNTGWCSWFQANGVLESTILKKYQTEYDFSEKYNRYATVRYFLNGEINPLGFNEYATMGANNFKIGALLSSRRGPINEIDMPFVNSMDLIDISEIQNKNTTAYVENFKMFPSYTSKNTDMINDMKEHLINHGALGIAYYHDDNYYNALTGAYYYAGGLDSLNHGVTLVGWDDNYSKTNFKLNYRPLNDGAWIIKNSWGTSWGNNGYVYISYDDLLLYKQVYGIETVSINKNYDNSYFYDPLGWNGAYGYSNNNPVYVANKFNKKTSKLESLTEITIGTLGITNFELYVNNIDANLTSVNMKLIKSGIVDYAGYYTIKLDEPIMLENQDFSIMVSYKVSGTQFPVPLQTSFSGIEPYYYDGYETNQSFSSPDKNTWHDLYNYSDKSVASIKAFTKTIEPNFTLGDIIKNPSIIYNKIGGEITLPINSSNITDSNLFNVKITNRDNIDVTSNFTITKTLIENDTFNIKFNFGLINAGDYNIEISYGDILKSTTFTIENFIDITDILVAESTINIIKEDSYIINYHILPIAATNKILNWSSSDSDIVSIDNNGKITALKTGSAIITISSTDGSNIVKTININVVDYEFSTNYNIEENYLVDVNSATSIEVFKNNFNLNGVTIKIINKDNQEVISGYVGTGMKVRIMYNTIIIEEYDIVVIGDSNGDGLVKSIDLSQMRFHLAGITGYVKENAYLRSLDINKSGTVTSIDLSQLRILIASG